MKTIRRFGIFAFALAALAAALPQSASAGSIRSITAWDPETGHRPYGPNDLVRIGESIAFKVRLLNYNTNGLPDGSKNNPWIFRRNPIYDATWATNNLPKMGLWISGHRRYATLKSISLAGGGDGSQAGFYTDLVFEYKAQAGDMALPVKFCNASGTSEILNSQDQTYLLENVGPAACWDLVDAQTGTPCEFYFGDELLSSTDYSNRFECRPPGWTPDWAINQGNEHRDYDLSLAQIYIQTVDFDEALSANWRTIYENKTTTVEGKLPTLIIPGGATEASTVYLWTEDSDVAILANGGEKVYNALTPDKSAYKDYTVYTANIVNEENYTFKVKGLHGASGRTTTIYLSTTPTNIYNSAGTRLINFVTQTIAVTNQANPEITFELDTSSITCDPVYGTSKARLTVTVDAFTNAVTVALNPTLTGGGAASVGPNGIINISSSADGALNAYSPTITYPARSSMDDEPAVYNYYVFGLGFPTNATYTSISQQILFSPTITGDGGAFGAVDSFTLTVKETSPSFTISNVSDEGNQTSAQTDFPLTLSLSDSYANLHDTTVGYTVWWKPEASSMSWQLVQSGVKAVDGELNVSVKYTSGGTFTSTIRVYGPDGLRCDADRSFSVTVAEAKKLSLSVDMDGDDEMPRTYYEGDPVKKVRVILHNWKNDTGSPIYAFLEPQGETASNISIEQFIVGHANCKGLKIENGATNTVSQTKSFKTLDGDKTLSFRVVIASVENWSAVTANNTVFTYDVEDIEVVNVAPKFDSVSMTGGSALTKGDGSETQHTDQELPKTFTWNVYDVDADLSTLKTRWTVVDPNGAQADQQTFTGDPTGLSYQYTFLQSGTYKMTVEMQDKDMGSREWTKFEFKVDVGDAPRTVFQFPDEPGLSGDGDRYTFLEDAVINGLNDNFQVGLSTPAKDPLVVKVTRAPYSGTDGTFDMAGADGDGAVYVTIPAGRTIGSFSAVSLEELDGTQSSGKNSGGFELVATVTNTNLSADGVPYNQIYKASKVRVLLMNVPPRVNVSPMAGVTNIVSANQQLSIEWEAEDVTADVNDNLRLMWSGIPSGATYAAGSVTSPTGTINFSFSKSGTYTVSLKIRDKDKGESEMFVWHYVIESSKDVQITAVGPAASGQSRKSNEYLTAAGAGDGRVFVEDGSFTGIRRFSHSYSFDLNSGSANAWAWGYRVGDVDDGNLPDLDKEIDSSGNNLGDTVITSFYTYPDAAYDSFFYAWVLNETDEQNNTKGISYPAPQIGKDGYVRKTFKFSDESEGDDDNPIYPPLVIDATFSRELRPADNLGDINMDGIPDVFAVSKAYNGGYLYEVAGGGEGGGEDGGVEGDLRNLTSFNEDEDYLPATTSSGNSLIPNVVANWATTGAKFTPYYEIRGFGAGLNYRKAANGLNYNVRGTWISDPDFTPAETNAYLRYYKANSGITKADPAVAAIAKIAATNDAAIVTAAKEACEAAGGDPANDDEWMAYVTPTDTHLDAALATYLDSPQLKARALAELATDACEWSPENRTDPTMDDTDGDGLPDGYEYFFWYRALVGDKDGKQMVGSKFNPNNIAQGIDITPEDIMAAFNPTVPSGVDVVERDTDGDGLTDLEELAIGTNPVNWDTDGDGVSDLYEVMWGLDPLKDFDMAAGDKNPDGDYMASWTSGKTWAVITVKDKGIYAVDESVAVLNGYVEGDKKDEGTIDASAEDVTINNAIPVFWYGADGTTPVPKIRQGCLTNFVSVVVTSNDTATVLRGKALRLIHDQVYDVFDFDPRTGWYSNSKGAVGDRWVAVAGDGDVFVDGTAGRATNTMAFTTLDEYLLCKYRKETGLAGGDKLRADLDASYTGTRKTVATLLWKGCTAPNMPKSGVTYGDLADTFGFDNIYGADTDGDGVPDGWELYVGANPNYAQDGSSNMNKSEGYVHDTLTLVEEYAGTDSCNAYSNTPSIFANHPGEKYGWYNKFFPTNPKNPDTDGDGLSDSEEGKSWRGSFYAGRKGGDTETMSTAFTFIYGPRTADGVEHGMPEADDGSRCIRGGGLNPCTVDTDLDLLPDGWERQFAGVVFNAEGQPEGNTLPDDVLKLFRFSDGLDDALGNTLATPTGYYITGGMDGTYGPRGNNQPGDAVTAFNDKVGSKDPRTGTRRDCDWDHDGLENFQEYLVQTLRHLRYDDCETPLMGYQLEFGAAGLIGRRPFKGCIPFQAFDGTAFYEECRKAGFRATSSWKFRELGYFARPPHEWDRLALNTEGNENCKNYEDYEGVGYRILLPPKGLSFEATSKNEKRLEATGYVSTDPRRWDTDDDGLDDYWEIFHGLNPLLGSSNLGVGDVIAEQYGFIPNAWINAWTGWPLLFPPQPPFDVMKYPWMIGTPECDADGDGIRNAEEGLFVNITTPSPKHTDPTPLWMTDKTSPNNISFTSQYYRMDPYKDANDTGVADLMYYPWIWQSGGGAGTSDGQVSNYMFSFEENEGYDTDSDRRSDSNEGVKMVENASDPLVFSDPDRRQALYLPGFANGVGAAVVSRGGSDTMQKPISSSYDLLRQFTVEAWVKPEKLSGDTEQVILERVSNYGPSTFSNDTPVIRANFRLGITTDNRYFAEFEGNTIDSGVQRLVGTEVSTNDWTHIAFTFDGSTFSMYVNDEEAPVARAENISLIPANGIVIIRQEAGSSTPVQNRGYTAAPCAFLIGARAVTGDAIALSKDTTWEAFGDYYTGWIDEVRVWDGARTGAEIAADYQKRYSFADVKSLRQDVYLSWRNGATRNDVAGKVLPVELVQHYNFSTLAGAIDSGSVMQEPLQFTGNVLDNVRIDEESVDDVLGEESGGLRVGWWWNIPVHSSVYTNYHLVPWVQNTCAHLPFMDGSTPDSMYWCENFGGLTPASPTYLFPNTANPYPFYNYLADRAAHAVRLKRFAEGENSPYAEFEKLYEFQLRSGFVGTSDLVPLGGAFAKRTSQLWDGGAADAWTQTGVDSDSDGLPDWWEDLVADGGVSGQKVWYAADSSGTTLLDRDAITWSTMVYRKFGDSGSFVKMTLAEAYQRDLAEGMIYDSEAHKVMVESAYAVKATVDVNGNGIPDWWEKLYALYGEDTVADHDNDQLSNFAEYLIGECFTMVNGVNRNTNVTNFRTLSPLDMFTYRDEGQRVPDYFLPVGSLYLGEMFTDHDFIEDWWERQVDDVTFASRFSYDAHKDSDDDGWSNYAECRHALWKASMQPDLIDGWISGNFHLMFHPDPIIGLKISYYGYQNVVNDSKQLVVRVSTGNNRIPDTIFKVACPLTADGGAMEIYESDAGIFREGVIVHGHLSPGRIQPGDEKFYLTSLSKGMVYKWRIKLDGSERYPYGTFLYESTGYAYYEGDSSEYMRVKNFLNEKVELLDAKVDWEGPFNEVRQIGNDGRYAEIVHKASKRAIGMIDYRTGEYELDMSKFKMAYLESNGSATELSNMVFKATYSYRIGTEWPQTLYLSNPELGDGYVREGTNIVSAFFDMNGDGKWNAGEPYGVAPAVDVGWWKAMAEIELTDTHPSMARYDLSSVLGGNSSSGSSSGSQGTVKITDRDVNGSLYDNVVISNSAVATAPNLVRLRVVRDAFNSSSSLYTEDAFREVVLDCTFNPNLRPILSEADLVAAGKFDLDWGTVTSAFTKVKSSSMMDLTNAVYRVFVGNGDIISSRSDTSVLPVKFVNAFEPRAYQTPTTPLTPSGTIDSGRPTFTWRHDQTVKDYPAFQLKVWKQDGTTLVYDSGVRKAPPRNKLGVYSWTAPLYANMVTDEGVIFSTTNNYKWAVSMLDAKFTSFRERGGGEVKKEFRLECSGASGSISDYGTIEAQIKYFGPGIVSNNATASRASLIRVQAFDTPDFTGDPAGEAYVANTDDIASVSNLTVNARIIGLKPGKYFVRAFIDTNGDGKRQAWESWGYANYVGTERHSVYDPKELTIDGDSIDIPLVTVYIEDTDMDDDGFPDVYEWDQKGNLDEMAPASGNTFFTQVNPDLLATMTAYSKLNVSVRSAASQAPIFRLMSAGASSAEGLNAFNGLFAGPNTVENETDIAVVIDSFSLEDGMTISIDPVVSAGTSGLLTVSTAPVSFSLELKYKASLAEEGWETVASVPLALTANEPVTLTGDDLAVLREKIAEIQTTGQAGFFKVVLTK